MFGSLILLICIVKSGEEILPYCGANYRARREKLINNIIKKLRKK